MRLPKIIGVIHLLPTLGFQGFESVETITNRALEDLEVLETGGVDGIIIENNYDLPHKVIVDQETIVIMGYVVGKIREKTHLPLGISVLWNDYKAALSIAKIYHCQFIRVPVFVDTVKTDFGIITGNPEDVINYRKKIQAEKVLLLTDIQVKHAKLLNLRPIKEAAIEATEKGSDGIIITGSWTGEAPIIKDIIDAKKGTEKPILVGSGATEENVKALLQYVDSIIVSTSLKEGENKNPEEERNIKKYVSRFDLVKIKRFIEATK